MSAILVLGRRFSVAAYRDRPAAFSRLLSEAKEAGEFAYCECTSPPPKMVIRTRSTTTGKRCSVAIWPNQGHEHDPRCFFFVSDGEYRQAELRRDREREAESTRLRGELETLAGILKHCFAPVNRNAGPTADWGAVHDRIAKSLTKADQASFPLAASIYVVPPFHIKQKETIETGWASFVDGHKASPQRSHGDFLVLGEIKSVESLEGCVITHLRHHRTPVFMSKDLASVMAKSHPEENRVLASSEEQGRVVALFRVEMTKRGNLWASDAAMLLLGEGYERSA
jgi:hypothetical protein